MGTFVNKYHNLRQQATSEISSLIRRRGEESKHISEQVLKIKKDELQFNLDGRRYLTEVGSTELIDNEGYSYNYDAITLEQLCEIIDSF